MKFIKISTILILFFYSVQLFGQVKLTAEEAVMRALENNFNIQLAENAADIAENNTSKFNTGKLPTVGLNAGYTYRSDNTTANFQDGRTTNLSFASSQAANASIGAGYTIFDGFFRKYNIEQLKEQYALSTLEVEATMENIAAQTLSQYYQIASLIANKAILNEAIIVSNRRLERAEQTFEFGQGDRLAVLNAQVDLNNDSLALLNLSIQIDNAKRLLNNLMVDQNEINYEVDSTVEFISGLSSESLKTNMLDENIALSQIDKRIDIGRISIDLANARKLPTLDANLSYGYNYNKNNPASFLSSINTNGLTAGVTLSWNIFDGGQTRHALEENRLNNIGLGLQKEQIIEDLELKFETAWANYRDRIFIYESQKKNVVISRSNFERTNEKFKIGQISSVDYRQAQLNVLNDEVALNSAKFQVKLAEVELLLLSGRIF